ncbi:MAG: fumarylacetoacetate hydrolase family protein [Pseudomonadales bacterium]|nr:fumarylacetoacetate hydrolase family protein [Pseudomonadales bacterium]
MVSFAIDPPSIPVVPIAGSEAVFPVHRIYCVGKNYAAHIREMGGTPGREPPCFFMKPADAIVTSGQVPYPSATANYHYEAELVIALGRAGTNIPRHEALAHVYAYAVGLDMTRRDLQTAAARVGLPWDTGKGFDHSAPISALHRVSESGHFSSGALRLHVNGELRQDADLSELIWKNDEIIAELSRYYDLQAGDLIYTGTPAGVGAVVRGDVLEASVENLDQLRVTIV